MSSYQFFATIGECLLLTLLASAFSQWKNKKTQWLISIILFISLLEIHLDIIVYVRQAKYFSFDITLFSNLLDVLVLSMTGLLFSRTSFFDLLFLGAWWPIMKQIARYLGYVLYAYIEPGYHGFARMMILIAMDKLQERVVLYALFALMLLTLFLIYFRKRLYIPRIKFMGLYTVILLSSCWLWNVLEEIYLTQKLPAHFSTVRKGGLVLILINVLTLVLLYRIQAEYQKAYQNSLMKQETEALENSLAAMKAQNAESAMLRHDLKNTYGVLKELLKQDEIEQAKRYIEQQTNLSMQLPYLIHTGIATVDAVLNSKQAKAKQKGICFQCMSNLSSLHRINDVEFGVLLANLLDNAIENVSVHNRFVQVDLYENKTQLTVRIVNRTDHDVLKENPLLKTTKQEAGHGLGIRSAQMIARKYHGTLTFSQIQQDFESLVVFVIQESKN